MKSFVGVLAIGAMIVLISSCGVNRQASSYQPAANSSTQGESTISQRTIQGVGQVLVSQMGMTLYSPDQEADGRILCTASCTRFWQPLLLSKGAKSPTKGEGVPGKLAVVDRPDGAKQVAFDGKPLYLFVEDGSPGDTKGNDFHDDFGGHRFSWQVVTVGKAPSANGSGSQNHGGYGGGY
jgi:predicted lipoprotein with Yx(FWY)xxD motif